MIRMCRKGYEASIVLCKVTVCSCMSVFELAMSYLLCQHSEYWTQMQKAPNAECHRGVQSPTQRLQTPYDRGNYKKGGGGMITILVWCFSQSSAVLAYLVRGTDPFVCGRSSNKTGQHRTHTVGFSGPGS